LFDELVAAAWNLRRIRRMETALCSSTSLEDLLKDDELQKKLDRLARHKTRIERTFHRSLKELKALQTNSFIEGTLPPVVRRNALPLSSAIEISKRTQQFEKRGEMQRPKMLFEAPAPLVSSSLE